jgi:PAS domain S-box-containing protein
MEIEHPVKLLLVDDRKENLLALEVILASENYVLVKANSGREALKILLEEQDFALILMDVQMPIMGGFETAELIRQSEKLKQIPIIYLTAHTETPEDTFKGYKTGAVDYMVKPLSPEILKAKVSVFTELYKKNNELTRLNNQLNQHSKYVRSIIEASLDPMLIIDSEGTINDVNQALEKITGLSRNKIKGTNFVDYVTNPKIAREVYQDVFAKGSIIDYLLTIKHADGKLTDVLFNGSVYKDEQGNVIGAVIVAREKMISRYSRSLIEASLDPLITINAEGKITDMNEALANITGITREKITGTDFFDYFTEPEKARDIYKEAFAKGFVVNSPLTIRHKDGKLTDVLFNGSTYKDERGNVLGIVIVARDVTEQKQFENELIEAKRNAERERQIAEQAVKAKQQFLSNMSHEIRTPMNAIIGFTKVVLNTELSKKQKEYIEAIKLSGDALIVLINDILDLAKVDAGKMTFEEAPFKLFTSISAMLQLFEAKIQENNLELVKEYDKSIPEVLLGDSVRLHQVILNLVSNAVKFTSKGKITVGVHLLEETSEKVTIEFSVTDTGIGIPEDKLDNIFDNFQQATAGTTRLYGGTGLGLAIAKQLIEAQGGKISVKSKVGEGSTFKFVLHFKKTTQKIEAETESNDSEKIQIKDQKILVVEDVKLNQLLMKTLLEHYGCKIDIAANGKIAIEKIKDGPYDMIFMDLQMPEMNGFEATEYIRKKLNSDVPIIALTADVTTADLDKCKAAGMDDYISKPVDDKLLYKKIMKYINSSTRSKTNDTVTKIKPGNSKINPHKYTNFDYLKELTIGKPEGISIMIKAYLEETPKLIQTMKRGIESKDWASVGAAAHSIIPSFSIVGISPEFEEIARKIQEYTTGKNPEGHLGEIKESFSKIEDICNLAMKELKQEL